MNSREDRIKAASAGLQPKSLDLTKFARARGANRVRSTRRVAPDDVAYAMGFAIGSVVIDGELYQGDPLGVALLRLKYAEQLSLKGFERALQLVLHRHVWHTGDQPGETLRAVAAAALVEWINDRCEKCRVPRGKALQPGACPECRPTTPKGKTNVAVRNVLELTAANGQRIERPVAQLSPRAGCPKCKGLGRIFAEPKIQRGMVCVTCHNSGIAYWRSKRRWRMTSELLVEEQRGRGRGVAGLPFETFRAHWSSVYRALIAVLREADRKMGACIDFGFSASQNRGIESGGEEKQDCALAERDDADELSSHEPAAAHRGDAA